MVAAHLRVSTQGHWRSHPHVAFIQAPFRVLGNLRQRPRDHRPMQRKLRNNGHFDGIFSCSARMNDA
jgi:hypothetical protein